MHVIIISTSFILGAFGSGKAGGFPKAACRGEFSLSGLIPVRQRTQRFLASPSPGAEVEAFPAFLSSLWPGILFRLEEKRAWPAMGCQDLLAEACSKRHREPRLEVMLDLAVEIASHVQDVANLGVGARSPWPSAHSSAANHLDAVIRSAEDLGGKRYMPIRTPKLRISCEGNKGAQLRASVRQRLVRQAVEDV